ncbi:MAG: helix-turn-helix domain-containing protein [Patescibacteria group bacterium]
MNIKHENLLKKLQKSGLTDKESSIYVALLELGGAYPSKIAEYTGLNRSTVYMLLTQMSVKGIVNEIEKKNKQFYQLESPTKLLRYAKSKMSIIQDEIENAQRILPDLEGLFGIGDKAKITYYEGIEGVLDIYATHINVSKPYEMLAWANVQEVEEQVPRDFFKNYIKTKKQKDISSRVIFPDTNIDKTFVERSYGDFKEELMPNARFIPADKFPYKAEITIYGEKNVSIINLGKEKLTGVIIEDPTIHGLMKMIFELSWTSSLIENKNKI